MKKKVLIVAYYFPPLGWSGVQRTLKFVKYLRNFGWQPVVLTVGKTKFSVMDESLSKEIPDDVKVIRIDDTVLKKVTDEMKINLEKYIESSLNMISDELLKKCFYDEIEKKIGELRDLLLLPDGNAIWANNVIKQINQYIDLKEFDIVYTTSAPYSAHIIGYNIKKKYNIHWVADFRDQWIKNPYIAYDKNSLKYKLESYMEKEIVKECDKLITTTSISKNNYISTYNLNKNKVIEITNGYDEEDFCDLELNLCKQNQNKFKIIYNGSFYMKRNPYTFAIALKELIKGGFINSSKVEIILNGKSDANIIDEFIKILGNNKNIIKFNNYLSHKESLRIASEANILLLVCGKDEAVKEVYTGKVFEYLRLKKPILSLSPKGSLVEELLIKTGCGVNVEYDDIEEIKKAILFYYNRWLTKNDVVVKANHIEDYERKELTKKLAAVFNKLL